MAVYWMSLISTCLLLNYTTAGELWQQDLSRDMKIGIADGGYESVKLRCGANSMQVDIKLTTDLGAEPDAFQGVIYTRGSFHAKKPPCFIDAEHHAPSDRNHNGRSFTLKFPLDKCQTLHEGDVYSNVVVVQYDRDLIMPGDAAFNLECDFSKPRDFTVNADLNGTVKRQVTASRIMLTDADPASRSDSRHRRSLAESASDYVIFTPEHANRKINDEL